MEKTTKDAVETLQAVSQALLAVNAIYVKDKNEKDGVIDQAFQIVKKELDFIKNQE